jgi:hypothetical protein
MAASNNQRSSEAAVAFIERLAGVARRLSTRDIVVSHLHCDWGSFGCWDFEVQKGTAADTYAAVLLGGDYDSQGPDVVHFMWDGRDKVLSVETAPTPPLSSPGPWRRLLDRSFEDGEQAVEFAERYAREWSADALPDRLE